MSNVVILGVTGSVAAYRAADLARELMRAGFEVRVCLSRAAAEFVTPALFEALTGNPVLTHAFDEPVKGRMAHIDWARDAAVICVAPATANALSVIARGGAEDMLSTIVVASSAALVVAPAMNPQMFASETVQADIKALKSRGCRIVSPDSGEVACGESGQGKLAAISEIVEAVTQAAYRSTLLDNKHVVITAGPTHEAIDPVRFLGNRSSGKMGFALAQAATQMGARVTLISGPTHLAPPPAASFVAAETADEMLAACIGACTDADIFISAAAIADFKVANPSLTKIKKSDEMLTLDLIKNPDILATAHAKYPSLHLVGFAAETHDHLENAQRKIAEKSLLAIAVNDVSRTDIGFSSEENEVTLVFEEGTVVHLGQDSKFNIAVEMLVEIHSRISQG